MNAYDEIVYPGYAYPQTHPDRLATLARLFGLEPPDVERCRVLEIGCGDGANLIPMAYGLPRAEFVGFDAALRPVERGRETIAALGLTNARLLHLDLLELPRDLGEFDYVVAHGLYSWVPPAVRDALLAACQTHLQPNGIAFISYNTQPGGHLRLMVREMMLYHIDRAPDNETRIKQARALLRFLSDGRQDRDEYERFLRSELDRVTAFPPGHLFHDDLAPINQPVYFHEFIAHAGRHGLAFLAEAHFPAMQDHEYPEETRALLAQLSQDVLAREQYLDFLSCRRFRQTLVCHAPTAHQRRATPSDPERLLVASSARPAREDVSLAPDVLEEFRGDRNAGLRTDRPFWKAVLLVLGDVWPERLEAKDLEARATERLTRAGMQPHASDLAEFLMAAYGAGVLSLHVTRPRLVAAPSARPRASAIARRQAIAGTSLTTLVHTTVSVPDDDTRRLLSLLDGTRTHDVLTADLSHSRQAAPVDRRTLADCLQALARLAVLEA